MKTHKSTAKYNTCVLSAKCRICLDTMEKDVRVILNFLSTIMKILSSTIMTIKSL